MKALLGEVYEDARIKQARSESPTTISSSGGAKKKRKEEDVDADAFPTAPVASQEKKAKTLYNDFNERANFGPRDLNGGVSARRNYRFLLPCC